MDDVKSGLHDFYEKNLSVENELAQAYTCNNVKLLEVVMEHLLFHWDDIVDLLINAKADVNIQHKKVSVVFGKHYAVKIQYESHCIHFMRISMV